MQIKHTLLSNIINLQLNKCLYIKDNFYCVQVCWSSGSDEEGFNARETITAADILYAHYGMI